MIDDIVVVDAVAHPYNLEAANQNPAAVEQLEAVYGAHVLTSDERHPEYTMTRAEFFSDVSFETIAEALFVESPVDFAVLHALPNLGFARSWVTDPDRAAAFRDRHPQRFAMYATVDTPDTDAAIAQLERQVEEHAVDSLKLYPAFFYDGQGEGWRLDGPNFGIPLLEAARDLGVRNVAIHKALWLPPAPREAFSIDDLSEPIERFGDLNFSMVHAGTAFVATTCELLARHRNFYATLETSFSYILVRPDHFARCLGSMLAAAGSEQLLYASGVNLSHPAPLLAAFADYQLPPAMAEEHGWPALTREDRVNILGANALRMHGLDAAGVATATAGDEFARRRAVGPVPPWSLLRAPETAAP